MLEEKVVRGEGEVVDVDDEGRAEPLWVREVEPSPGLAEARAEVEDTGTEELKVPLLAGKSAAEEDPAVPALPLPGFCEGPFAFLAVLKTSILVEYCRSEFAYRGDSLAAWNFLTGLVTPSHAFAGRFPKTMGDGSLRRLGTGREVL